MSNQHALATAEAISVFHPNTNGTVTVRLSIQDRANKVHIRSIKVMTTEQARAEYARLTKLGWYKW